MSKPDLRAKKVPSSRARAAHVSRSLWALIDDQRKWVFEGFHQRPPITRTEVLRRIAVMEEAVALLESGLK